MSAHDHHDETARRLTSALNQEAETVTTDPTALQRIQRRTSAEGAPSRQRWFLAAIGAAAATAAVIAAVVVIGDQGSQNPSTPAADDPSPTKAVQSPAEQVTVPVTYVGKPAADRAARLYTEQHQVTLHGTAKEAAAEAFLSSLPADADYTNGWPSGLHAAEISSPGGVTTVALEGPLDASLTPDPELGTDGGELAVQALFRTAGLAPGGSGTLTYNGDPVSTVLGVDLPVTGAPDVDVQALVSIDNIDEGQTVSSPVTVTVSGNTFEGTVNWLLLDANGAKLHIGYAMVGSYGEWAQVHIELGDLEPGTYTFKAFEQSAEDGSEINVDDKTFTVE